MPRPSNRNKLLDAAEARLLEHGPKGLVLDAIAADAGVSKGGLLYHFPSKEALASALVERMVAGFDDEQARLTGADGGGPAGRWTRAYLRSTVTSKGEPADHSAALMAGILAGMGAERERLVPLHEAFARWQEQLEDDGIDPIRATLVRLAADGLWLSALLGLPSIDKTLARDVLAELERLARE